MAACGIDPRAELADDLAVDGDPPLDDVFLALPARAQARMGQDLLKPLGLARPRLEGRGNGPTGHGLRSRSLGARAWSGAARTFGPLGASSRGRTGGVGASSRTWSPAGTRPRLRSRPARRLRFAMILPAGGLATSHDARSLSKARQRPDHRSRQSRSIDPPGDSLRPRVHSILETARTDGQGRLFVKKRSHRFRGARLLEEGHRARGLRQRPVPVALVLDESRAAARRPANWVRSRPGKGRFLNLSATLTTS